jgi:hypothetical protein
MGVVLQVNTFTAERYSPICRYVIQYPGGGPTSAQHTLREGGGDLSSCRVVISRQTLEIAPCNSYSV